MRILMKELFAAINEFYGECEKRAQFPNYQTIVEKVVENYQLNVLKTIKFDIFVYENMRLTSFYIKKHIFSLLLYIHRVCFRKMCLNFYYFFGVDIVLKHRKT